MPTIKIQHLLILFILCVSGALLAMIAKNIYATTKDNINYQSCLAFSLTGAALPDDGELPEQCRTLFTEPGRVSKLQFDNQQAWVHAMAVPIPRVELLHLHREILKTRPELAADMPDFEAWWQALPTGAAPK